MLDQFPGLSVGFPGLFNTSEYSKSISAVSATSLGYPQFGCCGAPPEDVNILEVIHKGLSPAGIPSVH